MARAKWFTLTVKISGYAKSKKSAIKDLQHRLEITAGLHPENFKILAVEQSVVPENIEGFSEGTKDTVKRNKSPDGLDTATPHPNSCG